MRYVMLLAILCLNLVGAQSTVFRVGLDVDAGTMDPRLARDTSAERMQDLIYNGLIRLDPQVVPQPDLALSWEFTSPTSLVVKLRPDVVFHNGQALSAEDVVYTYTTLIDEDFGSPRRSLYTPISKIEAIDELTVQFSLQHPYAPLLQYLDKGIVPQQIATDLGADFGDNPIGTGPFKLASWEKGNKIVLVANDDYYGGRPQIDMIELSIIPDNNVRLLALEAGDLDYIHSPVPPQDLERLRADGKLVVEQTTALGYTYLNLNAADSILADARVRQALAYLSDRDTISEVIFFGMDQPGKSFLLPGTFYYSEDVNIYPYDPEKAIALLDEAGWVDSDGDGIRDKDGQALQLELTTNVDPNRQQILEFLQGEWAQAGIDASVRVYEWPSFIGDVQAGNYQVGLIGWLLLTDPDRASYLQFRSDGGSNYGAYANAEVDDLLEQGRSQTDAGQRKDIYAQVAKLVSNDAPYVFLLYQGYVALHDPALEGYTLHPLGSWRSFETVTLTR